MFQLQQVIPGMLEKKERTCFDCSGRGEIIAAKDRCKDCNGKRTVRHRSFLDVHIEKGMQDGQKIIFREEGSQEPDKDPGDVVVQLRELEHPIFKRDGDDLKMVMTLPLSDALCGFEKIIKSVDDRDVLVKNNAGVVIKPGDIKFIYDEGMPQYENPMNRGRLIVFFEVILPTFIQPELVSKMAKCLPHQRSNENEDGVEQVELVHLFCSVKLKEFVINDSLLCEFQVDYDASQDTPEYAQWIEESFIRLSSVNQFSSRMWMDD